MAFFGLLSRGEAIWDKLAQYSSMRARVSVRVVPNMEALPYLQIIPDGYHRVDTEVYDLRLILLTMS